MLAWTLRRLTRNRDLTDAQSGLRAFSARSAAHAEVLSDEEPTGALTLDLLGKGYRYAEVPVRYTPRSSTNRPPWWARRLWHTWSAALREVNAPTAPAPERVPKVGSAR